MLDGIRRSKNVSYDTLNELKKLGETSEMIQFKRAEIEEKIEIISAWNVANFKDADAFKKFSLYKKYVSLKEECEFEKEEEFLVSWIKKFEKVILKLEEEMKTKIMKDPDFKTGLSNSKPLSGSMLEHVSWKIFDFWLESSKLHHPEIWINQ